MSVHSAARQPTAQEVMANTRQYYDSALSTGSSEIRTRYAQTVAGLSQYAMALDHFERQSPQSQINSAVAAVRNGQ